MENAIPNFQEKLTILENKMKYKCFECGKEVGEDYTRKKIRCPYCGGRILFKPRVVTTKIKAR